MRIRGSSVTNLDHLIDGTLVPGDPDIHYRAHPEQLDRRLRDELSEYIDHSTQHDLLIAPNLSLKGERT